MEYAWIKSLNILHQVKSKANYKLPISDDLYEEIKHCVDDPETYFKISGVWRDWADFLGQSHQPDKIKWLKNLSQIKTLDDYYLNADVPENPELYYKKISNLISCVGQFERR
jgi:hypothetical protein